MTNSIQPSPTIIRLPEVIRRTGLSRSTIYSKIQSRTFPQAIPLGERAVGWDSHAVDHWIRTRIQEAGDSGNGGWK